MSAARGNILFFDTETSGLILKDRALGDAAQPHICQLGAILTNDVGRVLHEINMIIRPDGWTIPVSASSIHGITQEVAAAVGLSIRGVLGVFARILEKADVLVAHNIGFDLQMLEREGLMVGVGRSPEGQRRLAGMGVSPLVISCTMEMATELVRIPPTEKMKQWGYGNKFKNPNLQECHEFFFGRPFEGAHDAMADVRACRDVYFEMMRRAT